ncbi:MAG: hypothetical protein H6711_20970 [Myxococcales bacterium]|nr:hypothetical protein [Myxococcales bacterium]
MPRVSILSSTAPSAALVVALALALTPACGGDDGGASASATTGSTSGGSTSEGSASSTSSTSGGSGSTSEGSGSGTSGSSGGTTSAGETDTGATTGGAEPVIIDGFDHPESALWDPMGQRWYVSNIGGDPSAKDGNGFIARLAADGAVEAMQWATGLDGPKGMGLIGDRLYVCDIDQIRVINALDGTLAASVAIDGAVFLNDLVVDAQGALVFSDTGTNTIHRMVPGETPSVVIQDPALHGPNGLTVIGGRLYVASLGDGGGEGMLFEVGMGSITPIGDLTGQLDGLIGRVDDFLVTDFGGKLYRAPADGGPVELLRDFVAADGFMSSADLGYARTLGVIAVPDLLGDKVGLFTLAP